MAEVKRAPTTIELADDATNNASIINRGLRKREKEIDELISEKKYGGVLASLRRPKNLINFWKKAFPSYHEAVKFGKQYYILAFCKVSWDEHSCVQGKISELSKIYFGVEQLNIVRGIETSASNYMYDFLIPVKAPVTSWKSELENLKKRLITSFPEEQKPFFNEMNPLGYAYRAYGFDGFWAIWKCVVKKSKPFYGHELSPLRYAEVIPIFGCMDGEYMLIQYESHERERMKQVIESLEEKHDLKVDPLCIIEAPRITLLDNELSHYGSPNIEQRLMEVIRQEPRIPEIANAFFEQRDATESVDATLKEIARRYKLVPKVLKEKLEIIFEIEKRFGRIILNSIFHTPEIKLLKNDEIVRLKKFSPEIMDYKGYYIYQRDLR